MVNEKVGVEAVKEMFAAFGNTNAAQAKVYIKKLSQFPPELIAKACEKAVLEQKFMPSLSEIMDATRSLVGTIDESKREIPFGEAWEIMTGISGEYHGAAGRNWEEDKRLTPAIKKTISRLDFVRTFGNAADSMLDALRAQTRKVYEEELKAYREKQTNEFVLNKDKTHKIAASAPKELVNHA